MINNNYIAFLYGVLVKIVDDIIDFNIFPQYKLFFEAILLLLTVYVIFFNTLLSGIASCTFAIGGFIALLFIPHTVNATIWRLIIMLAVPRCIYCIPQLMNLHKQLNITDIRNVSYFIVPLLLVATIFSIIEDIVIPEEYGYNKLIDKGFQSFIMIIFLFLIDFIGERIHLNNSHKQLLIILSCGWLGYALTSVVILTLFINK